LEVFTIFCELNQLENDLNRPHSAGPNPAHGYSERHGGRPAGWAMAWQSGPATEAACGAGAGRAPDALTMWSPRGGHAHGDKVSQNRQREHREGGGNAPDEVVAVRAHPSSGSPCGGGADAARRCPTVAEVPRSWVALVAGSCSVGGERRG
jgi:hypothetical protein